MTDFERLTLSGAQPRFHGAGFIQIPLSDLCRLHIWSHKLPAILDIPGTIHDHSFSFESKVVYGTIVHRTYDFCPDENGFYAAVAVPPKPENTPKTILIAKPQEKPETVRGHLRNTGIYTLKEDSKYYFGTNLFHSLVAVTPLAATIVTHMGDKGNWPRAIAVNGNDLQDAYPEKPPYSGVDMWNVIRDICTSVNIYP